MRRRILFASLGLLILLSAANCRADEITADMCKADVRLQTRVTLRSPHILVGELLERLSKQSGVTLTDDPWSLAGSDSVAVSLRDVPLADAMNALWSLFSYKHAEWEWRRSIGKKAGSQYVYSLVRPAAARYLAERLKEEVQTDFEAQGQKLFDALDMPQDQLKEAAKHDLLLDSLLDDGRVGPGMRILASLPPETLLNIVRNHQGITMPISQLPPDAQKSVQDARDWEIAQAAKQNIPASALGKVSDSISIYVASDASSIAPGLGIDTGWGSGDYFGGGFMEDSWREKMNALWMLPEDGIDDPASAHTLIAAKQPLSPVDQADALAEALLRFADAARIPLIARVPRTHETSSAVGQIPDFKTVKAFLEKEPQKDLGLAHKWRGGVLLLACQNWFVNENEDARLPWSEVRRLRDVEAVGDGFVSLGDIAHAAAVLNIAQMQTLGEWFPVMTSAAEWHDILAFYDKTPEYRPKILSAQGDDFQFPESMVNSQLGIDALRVTHPNLRLQIREKSQTTRKPPLHQVLFIVLDDAGIHGLSGRGFGYEAYEYQASLKVEEGILAGSKKSATTTLPFR